MFDPHNTFIHIFADGGAVVAVVAWSSCSLDHVEILILLPFLFKLICIHFFYILLLFFASSWSLSATTRPTCQSFCLSIHPSNIKSMQSNSSGSSSSHHSPTTTKNRRLSCHDDDPINLLIKWYGLIFFLPWPSSSSFYFVVIIIDCINEASLFTILVFQLLVKKYFCAHREIYYRQYF